MVTLIFELIAIEVWRLQVKPWLEQLGYADQGTMIPYMVVRCRREGLYFHYADK